MKTPEQILDWINNHIENNEKTKNKYSKFSEDGLFVSTGYAVYEGCINEIILLKTLKQFITEGGEE